MLVHAKNITKSYGSLPVLRGVDLELEAGKLVALVGASGAGKTTLLQIIGTLDQPDGGTLAFDGDDLLAWNERKLAAFRNEQLGFVFQFHHLMGEFTALENTMMPALIQGKKKAAVQARAKELLGQLGVAERADHLPNELSGGEKQRVAVARALMNGPRLILADEPTGNLDTENSRALYELLHGLTRELGVAVLVATHSRDLAAEADRIIQMKDGLLQAAQTAKA